MRHEGGTARRELGSSRGRRREKEGGDDRWGPLVGRNQREGGGERAGPVGDGPSRAASWAWPEKERVFFFSRFKQATKFEFITQNKILQHEMHSKKL